MCWILAGRRRIDSTNIFGVPFRSPLHNTHTDTQCRAASNILRIRPSFPGCSGHSKTRIQRDTQAERRSAYRERDAASGRGEAGRVGDVELRVVDGTLGPEPAGTTTTRNNSSNQWLSERGREI